MPKFTEMTHDEIKGLLDTAWSKETRQKLIDHINEFKGAQMKAFPTHKEEGMELRDYFAAKAMQAFINAWVTTSKYPNSDIEVADYAYTMADAMIEARKNETN